MGVVVRRYMYIDILTTIITFPYSTYISSFLGSSIPTYFFVHLKNVFSFLFMLFLCNIANVVQRIFEIVQKSRSRERGNIIILTRMYVDCALARVPRPPRARYCMTF